VDPRNVPVIDAHCHPWDVNELRSRPASRFLDRLSLTSMLVAAGPGAQEEKAVERVSRHDPIVSAATRRLAALFGCDDTRDAVNTARMMALSAGAAEYTARLWADARLFGMLVDDGFPRMKGGFNSFLSSGPGTKVFRVARADPAVERLATEAETFDALEARFRDWVRTACSEEGVVAFKSVIAYRTGLDVERWDISDARSSFRDWRAAGFPADHVCAKPVRDTLLASLLSESRLLGRPVHIHCGGGDPDVNLRHARPGLLFDLLSRHKDQAIVLVHAGWPWLEEAAYLATVFPSVYLEMSLTTPWSSLALDQRLELALGMVSYGKLLHGSDEASEPEIIWLAAHVAREAYSRVLSKAVEHDWLSEREARAASQRVLWRNCAEVHGLSLGQFPDEQDGGEEAEI